MPDVSRHIRIFDKDPSDDLVTKRSNTISGMAEKLLKLKSYSDFFQVAEDISRALESDQLHLPEVRVKEVEEAIRVQSSSFDRDGQQLQILTCLMLAVLKVVEEGQPTATSLSKPEVIAVSVWLSLGIQKACGEPKLEVLRIELLNAARTLVERSGKVSRERSVVPDPDAKISEVTDGRVVSESVNKGLLKSVETLRQNAALDREELDLLWWALGDWSELQSRHFRQLSMQAAAITAGVECSKVLRRIPSEGHKHVALRHIQDEAELNVVEYVGSLGADVECIQDLYAADGHIGKFPHIFRLLACVNGHSLASQEQGNRAWGARAMLEAVVLRLSQTNGPVL